ncbi:MAG: hypothetical protein SFV15_19360 [Polyangiaceae bacterium]|nr:hypothetical protein [Polyangiaceae bacterium]
MNPWVTGESVVAERSIVWIGFPRTRLMGSLRDDRAGAFAAADVRNQQFEYCEWHTQRNAAGKITKITFCTETGEYWGALANFDRNLVLNLYRSLVSPAVSMNDLFPGGGSYLPTNRWNTTDGIVHYIVGINTLAAAVGVVAGGVGFASSVTPDNQAQQADPAPPHAADPRVKLDAAAVTRLGFGVGLREPIGIYIAGWDDTGFSKPDGSPAGNYWRIVRGHAGAALRVEYQVPAGEGFVVGDMRIGGRRIAYGSQVAEHITVMAGALAISRGR